MRPQVSNTETTLTFIEWVIAWLDEHYPLPPKQTR